MDWGFILSVPYLTCLTAIAASTVTDIKVREVPDWISYTLIALGLLFGAAHSYVYKDWTLAWSFLGLGIGFGIGAALYYSGQWGGGDAKLLAGIGAIMTIPGPWFLLLAKDPLHATPVPFFFLFFGLMILCGMVYGLVWMTVLIIKNWSRFIKRLSEQLKTHPYNWLRIGVWVFTAGCLVAALYWRELQGLLFVLLAGLIYGSFYLIVAIRIVEAEFMLKTIKAKQLTEGDWVVNGVKLGKAWIIPEKNIGATKEQIAMLMKKAPNKKITIKEGIPFVPSFLAAFILAAL